MGSLVWDEVYREQGEVQSEVLPTVKAAVGFLKNRKCSRVLDLGCGTGRHTLFLARQGFEVYACDISGTGIEIVRKKAEELELNNISLKQEDMRRLDYGDSFFDAVICVWSLGIGKYEDIEQSVNEIYRVLKPKGVAIMDFQSVEDQTCGIGRMIEENTYIGGFEGLDSLPNHYSTKEEVEYLTRSFSVSDIKPYDYFFNIEGEQEEIKAFYVEAIK